MDVVQIAPPVAFPASECQQTLMVHSFAWSYGKPFAASYQPPACSFNRVTLNFTVTSSGRQFDRLAIMYLTDTEIWRTSTAEPTANGIIWTYIKDVSNYLALWRHPQKLIFDLGNLIDSTYTGPFNTTLTATFFTTPEQPAPANVIIPVSARRSSQNQSSAFSVPEVPAVSSLTIPRNTKRAVFSISACGQADEEFWWSNALSSLTGTYQNNTLLGFSPFREVQLLIDGKLAGVVWPFPVIFTGGVVPGFWRPIVGIDAYDLREDEIDVTPWLGVLSDGKEHVFEILIRGIVDDGQGGAVLSSVGNYWVVTGKLFLWLDPPGAVTRGSVPVFNAPDPTLVVSSAITQKPDGGNDTFTQKAYAQRQFSLAADITTTSGRKRATWSQSLSFTNDGWYGDDGNAQVNTQLTSGNEASGSGYTRRFSYPLYVESFVKTEKSSRNLSIDAVMDRIKDVTVVGRSAFPTGLESFDDGPFEGSRLRTRQNGSASYMSVPSQNRSSSWGGTEQTLSFWGLQAGSAADGALEQNDQVDLYWRHALAINGSIVDDSDAGANRVPYQIQTPIAGQNSGELRMEFPVFIGPVVPGRRPHIA
ncbi:hypothetical protein EJ06DRAFT_557491 [Trichodelitschia bisporula]|uniref:Peptide N-acetyl-beta-D-glucosaminyl asparaginase amidase A N-terminal domain-containing protein n=1 Tax=Trichodelitschia bisporula TaxID=703511 RepID=A0A6G1HSH5_9PEZI|nr:hypothetical protein EJ06DRAFT_557491 [Trichodelitschia bisporula]